MFKGIDEAMQKLENTSVQMDGLVAGITNIENLLTEQNELLRMLAHRES